MSAGGAPFAQSFASKTWRQHTGRTCEHYEVLYRQTAGDRGRVSGKRVRSDAIEVVREKAINTVQVNLDPTALYANGLSPQDVSNAVAPHCRFRLVYSFRVP